MCACICVWPCVLVFKNVCVYVFVYLLSNLPLFTKQRSVYYQYSSLSA